MPQQSSANSKSPPTTTRARAALQNEAQDVTNAALSSAEQPQDEDDRERDKTNERPRRVHSCIKCQERKVKCDKKLPCTNCVRVKAQCIESIPAPPRRRKRKMNAEELTARLKKYENLMKGVGLPVQPDDGFPPIAEQEDGDDGMDVDRHQGDSQGGDDHRDDPGKPPRHWWNGRDPPVRSRHRKAEKEKLVTNGANAKLLDNTLWTGLTDEFKDPGDMIQRPPDERQCTMSPLTSSLHSDGGAFLFGLGFVAPSLTNLHPQHVTIFRLWQTFLDNVNPLSKLLHSPTVQHQIIESTSSLFKIPRPMEALLFAIYAAAVNSMDEEECQRVLRDSKSKLLKKYLLATQQALIRASFLKTLDVVVLQAYTIFLLSIRQTYDPHALWILTGIAVRIGQRMGIHRDGAALGLSVFDTEMRRRLCWQIVLLDSRSAQVSGSGAPVMDTLWDLKLPLNFNDSDLNPDMREPPMEHSGLTEMVFCLMRYEFGNFLRECSTKGYDAHWQSLSDAAVSLAEKDRRLEELEARIENKFLRYCDPLIPLHTLTSAIARSAICKMRLASHHPRQYADRGASMTQAEKDMLFNTSLRMIEYDTLGQTMRVLRRYLWHINCFFQLDAFVYMVNELRNRTSGELADRAWESVQDVYNHHPELIADGMNPLHVAVGNLTIKAWEAREADLEKIYGQPPEIPHFVSMLRTQRMPRPPEQSPGHHGINMSHQADGDDRSYDSSHHEDDFQVVDPYLQTTETPSSGTMNNQYNSPNGVPILNSDGVPPGPNSYNGAPYSDASVNSATISANASNPYPITHKSPYPIIQQVPHQSSHQMPYPHGQQPLPSLTNQGYLSQQHALPHHQPSYASNPYSQQNSGPQIIDAQFGGDVSLGDQIFNERGDVEVAELNPEGVMDWDYWNDLLAANEVYVVEGGGARLFV